MEMAALFLMLFAIVTSLPVLEALRSYGVISKMKKWQHPNIHTIAQKIALQDIKPFSFPPLRAKTSTRMAMGLKRLDDSNWLTVDEKYLPEHTLRQHLLATLRPNVIQCLAPSTVACHEVLDAAVSFLTRRFPSQFTTSKTLSGPVIHNSLTGETFPVGSQCQNPLEVAALLAMEDFNILIKDPKSGNYLLQASATLFPAGWKLQERVGGCMACLHAPVPGWDAKLGAYVNRYFDHLSPSTAMERTNLFIQTSNAYFQDEPELISSGSSIKASDITVRRERQTFTRLPKSNAVLFTVRTYMTSLIELEDEELNALRSQIWGWETEMKIYKGWNLWGNALGGFCEERLGKRDTCVRVKKGGCPI